MQNRQSITIHFTDLQMALERLMPHQRATEIETLVMQVKLEASTVSDKAALLTLLCGVAFLNDTSPSLVD